MPADTLKLKIEPIPKTCYEQNVRTMIPRSRWDKFRKKIYAAQNNRCCRCASQTRLNCHEVWEYDDFTHAQVAFNNHMQEALLLWNERSRHTWTTDYGKWTWLVSGQEQPTPGEAHAPRDCVR